MQYDPLRQRHNQAVHHIEHSYCQQDTVTIEQLRRERQPQQLLILTVVSPELHFDAAVGLCVEGSLKEACDART